MHPEPIPIPPNDDPAAACDLWIYQDPKGRFWNAAGTWTTITAATIYPGNFEQSNGEADPPTTPPRGLSGDLTDYHWRRLTSILGPRS